MRTIPLDVAEKRLRALIREAREGVRFVVTEDFLPQARLLPPEKRNDGRDLDFLALKRHLARSQPAPRPIEWQRATLYAKRSA